jgi:hypothetical protein
MINHIANFPMSPMPESLPILLATPESTDISKTNMTIDRKRRRPSEIEDDVDQGSDQRNTKVRFDPKVDSEPFVGNTLAEHSESEYEAEAASVKVSFLKHHLVARAKPHFIRSWLSIVAQ